MRACVALVSNLAALWTPRYVPILIGLCLALLAPAIVLSQDSHDGRNNQAPVQVETLLFADPFQEELSGGWSWRRENNNAWRVEGGELQIRVQPGNLWGGANNVKNVLVRELPKGSSDTKTIAIEVASRHKPTGQYEQAGMAWYYDDSNMVKLTNEWIDGRPNVVMGREQDDRTRTIAIIPIPDPVVQLRLLISGDQITGQYRPDEKGPWKKAGTCDSPRNGPARVSLHTYNGRPNSTNWARFSGFRIYKPGSKAAEHIQAVIDELEVECLDRYVPIIGRMKVERLAELVRQKKPRVVVECGTAWGYSGLWIARELKAAGRGKLITIEISPQSAARARAEFKKAGVDDVVTVIVGDARKMVREVDEPVDFVLIDCNAPNYLPCIEGLEKNLAKGAVIVADNAGLSAAGLNGYFEFVRSRYKSHTEWFEVNLPWAKRDALEVSIVGERQ